LRSAQGHEVRSFFQPPKVVYLFLTVLNPAGLSMTASGMRSFLSRTISTSNLKANLLFYTFMMRKGRYDHYSKCLMMIWFFLRFVTLIQRLPIRIEVMPFFLSLV
jgi:hypothetical protein